MNINGNWMNFAYMDNPTLYTSAYLVASPQGYTKHYYAGSERIASAIGLGGLTNIDSPLELTTYHNSWEDKSTALNEMMTRTIRDCLGNDFNNNRNLEILYNLTEATSDTIDRYFYHPDHLGSSSWITDGSGNAIQHLHYLPFGEDWVDQRNSSWNAPYTFSGKEKDVETGYGYFGARYYDSGLSIWLSVDPMSDKYPNLSPYNYCANNPVIMVDPDGRKYLPKDEIIANFLISIANNVIYDNFKFITKNQKSIDKLTKKLNKNGLSEDKKLEIQNEIDQCKRGIAEAELQNKLLNEGITTLEYFKSDDTPYLKFDPNPTKDGKGHPVKIGDDWSIQYLNIDNLAFHEIMHLGDYLFRQQETNSTLNEDGLVSTSIIDNNYSQRNKNELKAYQAQNAWLMAYPSENALSTTKVEAWMKKEGFWK